MSAGPSSSVASFAFVGEKALTGFLSFLRFQAEAFCVVGAFRMSNCAPPDGPVIFVNWHRYQAFLIPHHGAHRRWMLVSPAAPPAPVARFSLLCGLNLVRGASGDRGKQALEELAQVLSAGHSITLAVDGPAGPRFRAKRGCADLAIRTGFPVVPVRYQSIDHSYLRASIGFSAAAFRAG
jgi:lysophospholipid acyltransferase (LPLAT)-like uncharacterized protein